MPWSTVLARLSDSLRRRKHNQDLDDEIAFHLAEEANLLAGRGAPQEDARHAARRAFGSVARTKEDARAVRVSVTIEQLIQDLRFGARILTKSPALSATAVLLIALVIGGNTTVFSIAHGLLGKPAPGVTASRLVTLSWMDDKGWIEPFNSYIAYEAFRDNATLGALLGWDMTRATLSSRDGSHAIWRGFVTPNYFDTLGVRFVKGRTFTKEEATAVTGLVAVLSHHAWQNYFHGDESIVGRSVTVNHQPATIIGVTAPLFRGAVPAPPTDVWVPLESALSEARMAAVAPAETTDMSTIQTARGTHAGPSDIAIGMIGRLAPGVSRSQAHTELAGIWARVQAAHPALNPKLKLTLTPYSATAGSNSLLAQRGGMFLAVFSIVTLMTLLVVCANVANLLVGRAVVRQRELSVRQSLGASRARIVRALLAEGVVLSVIAWIGACLFAVWTSRALSGFLAPTTQGMAAMPDFTPDWTVVGYALLLAVACMVASTVAPAMRACRQQLIPSLKAGEQAVIRGRSRMTSGLVVLQLAFSVLLVTAAGLAYRSLSLVGGFHPGFNTRGLALISVNTAGSANTPAENALLLDRLTGEIGRVSGVVHVAHARNPPREFWSTAPVQVPGSPAAPLRAETTRVGSGYLRIFGVLPIAGRDFGPEDRHRSMQSALISQNLAARLWPGQLPLGRPIVVDKQIAEVVGVVPDLFFSGFRREHPAFVFLSAEQTPPGPGESTLYVKLAGGLDTTAAAIQQALQRADPRTPVVYMRTWDAQLDSATWPIRVLTMLLMLFAGGSLFIAAIGQYAVVAFDMRRRVRELGLRLALGASARQIMVGVLREGFALTAIGLIIGFALSLAAGRLLGGVLYGITSTDPFTYFAVFALLSAASLLACYVPARRAALINPTVALRIE